MKEFIYEEVMRDYEVNYYITDYHKEKITLYTKDDESICDISMSKRKLKRIDKMSFVNAWNHLVELFGN